MIVRSFIISFFASLLSCASLPAKQVDSISIKSTSMNKEIQNIIILPEHYDSKTHFPVVILLHGYSGNHKSWLQIHPGLPQLATQYGIILVCPDGQNSWYWDSPINPSLKYETYVSKELVNYIDKHYKTNPNKNGRAITGLSMGGHGGLWIGFRHTDLFGACGSTSGGVDIRPFPDNWEMKKSIGNYAENKKRWDEHTVINQLDLIQSHTPAIIVDCGADDFFYEVNESLHKKMLSRKIPHDYYIRPGAHNAAYWKNSIEYQLLFFHLFFQQQAALK